MREVQNYWDSMPKKWGRKASVAVGRSFLYNFIMTVTHRTILKRIVSWCAPITVLEVGSGDGRIIKKVKAPMKVGMDISLGMLTRTFYGNRVRADARFLPFRNQSFDLVYSVTVLLHIPAGFIGGIVDEMKRVSKNFILIIEPLPTFDHLDKPYSEGGHCFPHDYRSLFQLRVLYNLKLPRRFKEEAILFTKH